MVLGIIFIGNATKICKKKCPRGHELRYFQNCGNHHCDYCNKGLNRDDMIYPESEEMFSCRSCNFDLCKRCYATGFWYWSDRVDSEAYQQWHLMNWDSRYWVGSADRTYVNHDTFKKERVDAQDKRIYDGDLCKVQNNSGLWQYGIWTGTFIDTGNEVLRVEFSVGRKHDTVTEEEKTAYFHKDHTICPGKHVLHGFTTKAKMQCHGCISKNRLVELEKGQKMYGCRVCNYNLGTCCYIPPKVEPKLTLELKNIEWAHIRTIKMHEYKNIKTEINRTQSTKDSEHIAEISEEERKNLERKGYTWQIGSEVTVGAKGQLECFKLEASTKFSTEYENKKVNEKRTKQLERQMNSLTKNKKISFRTSTTSTEGYKADMTDDVHIFRLQYTVIKKPGNIEFTMMATDKEFERTGLAKDKSTWPTNEDAKFIMGLNSDIWADPMILKIGSSVEIYGLVKQEYLNGRFGRIIHEREDKRFCVDLACKEKKILAICDFAAQPFRDAQPENGLNAALGDAFNTNGHSNMKNECVMIPATRYWIKPENLRMKTQ
jgi:hypothetical protein